jgi:hypothetical protein
MASASLSHPLTSPSANSPPSSSNRNSGERSRSIAKVTRWIGQRTPQFAHIHSWREWEVKSSTFRTVLKMTGRSLSGWQLRHSSRVLRRSNRGYRLMLKRQRDAHLLLQTPEPRFSTTNWRRSWRRSLVPAPLRSSHLTPDFLSFPDLMVALVACVTISGHGRKTAEHPRDRGRSHV